ncbi:signal transduction protein [Paenibacillus sp. 79R4]|uniref:DUF294 nucleotidyltransferase-like domain-containing protein n=1 Tax=Paenibacillus sp. 79R4 TaxID=2212847 RepID=UPI0015C115F9|nr:DUF294 nucleotidyltransferase-like domain-containing protein [Paenibacillus sp. 79R4]NWL89422.1 signal transduction protein [Paenibacillus sp. 79R4]
MPKELKDQDFADWLGEIRGATSSRELLAARNKRQKIVNKSLVSMAVEEGNRQIAQIHREVMCRALTLCEATCIQEGLGPPPVPYAFIALGSAGREEQTLWSDQDHALVIGAGDGQQVDFYYERFAAILVRILEEAGYPPCPGKVMISNPLWRRTLASWQQMLSDWREELGWEQVRYLMIAADMRLITGDAGLFAQLRANIDEVLGSSAEHEQDLVLAVLRGTVRHKAALNVLGQVITERNGEHAGDFDVKYGLYLPIVNAVRFLAVEHGVVSSNSTLDRLRRLYELEALPFRWIEMCREAFIIALKFRSLAAGYEGENGLLTGSNYLPQAMLKQREIRRELQEALGTVKLIYRSLERQRRYAERIWS